MCPDLSHPISLIGRIIPYLSNTALFHLQGHTDVNPLPWHNDTRNHPAEYKCRKFDAVHFCHLRVIALQRGLRHMSLGRKKNKKHLNCVDDTTLNSFSCVVFSNTWAANNVGVSGHEL